MVSGSAAAAPSAISRAVRRRPRGREIHRVEAARIIDQRRIAAGSDVLDDLGDRGVDIGRTLPLCREQLSEPRLETGVAGGERNRHQRPLPSPAPLRSAPSPAVRERDGTAPILTLPRTAGEGDPAPSLTLDRLRGREWVGAGWGRTLCD